jgi:hypothetical protein
MGPAFQRRTRRIVGLSVAVVAAAACIVFVGGEKEPDDSLQQARSALEQARQAGGPAWAGAEFAHAERLLESGVADVEAQSRRLGILRDYQRAREILVAAKEDAVSAGESARRERERARQDAMESLTRAKTTLQGARAALQIAPSPRDGKAELTNLRSVLHSVESQLDDVERLIQSEDYLGAASRASDLTSRVQQALARFFGEIEDGASHGGRSAAAAECLGAGEALSWGRPCRGLEVHA